MNFIEMLSFESTFGGYNCSKLPTNYCKYNKNAYKMKKSCQNICTCQK